MNVGKKIKKVEINGKEFIMCFDMQSIKTYKHLTGKSYLQSSADLGKFDDELMISFLGATLREKETPGTPIAEKVYDMDLLYLLNEHSWDVIDLVTSAMPQNKNKVKK